VAVLFLQPPHLVVQEEPVIRPPHLHLKETMAEVLFNLLRFMRVAAVVHQQLVVQATAMAATVLHRPSRVLA
jgi:hypothetical protein